MAEIKAIMAVTTGGIGMPGASVVNATKIRKIARRINPILLLSRIVIIL